MIITKYSAKIHVQHCNKTDVYYNKVKRLIIGLYQGHALRCRSNTHIPAIKFIYMSL